MPRGEALTYEKASTQFKRFLARRSPDARVAYLKMLQNEIKGGAASDGAGAGAGTKRRKKAAPAEDATTAPAAAAPRKKAKKKKKAPAAPVETDQGGEG